MRVWTSASYLSNSPPLPSLTRQICVSTAPQAFTCIPCEGGNYLVEDTGVIPSFQDVVSRFSIGKWVEYDPRGAEIPTSAFKFVVLKHVRAKLLVPSRHHAGLINCIPSVDLCTKDLENKWF